MTQYYLSVELSRYVDEHGGRDWLSELVRREMDQLPTVCEVLGQLGTVIDEYRPVTQTVNRFCVHCGLKLQTPGARICFHCQKPQS